MKTSPWPVSKRLKSAKYNGNYDSYKGAGYGMWSAERAALSRAEARSVNISMRRGVYADGRLPYGENLKSVRNPHVMKGYILWYWMRLETTWVAYSARWQATLSCERRCRRGKYQKANQNPSPVIGRREISQSRVYDLGMQCCVRIDTASCEIRGNILTLSLSPKYSPYNQRNYQGLSSNRNLRERER